MKKLKLAEYRNADRLETLYQYIHDKRFSLQMDDLATLYELGMFAVKHNLPNQAIDELWTVFKGSDLESIKETQHA